MTPELPDPAGAQCTVTPTPATKRCEWARRQCPRLMLLLLVLTPLVIGAQLSPLTEAPGPAFVALADAARQGLHDEGASVWGMIQRYTDSHVVVNDKRYKLAKNVVIDTYSLEKDSRGNVRLTLDTQGRVVQMFFYGLDMPDVVRRYKM